MRKQRRNVSGIKRGRRGLVNGKSEPWSFTRTLNSTDILVSCHRCTRLGKECLRKEAVARRRKPEKSTYVHLYRPCSFDMYPVNRIDANQHATDERRNFRNLKTNSTISSMLYLRRHRNYKRRRLRRPPLRCFQLQHPRRLHRLDRTALDTLRLLSLSLTILRTQHIGTTAC